VCAATSQPNDAANSAATVGVIVLPTMPRAPETESMSGASLEALDIDSSLQLREPARGQSYTRLPMFALEVETEFSAAHAITIAGTRERVHGHNFRVNAAVSGAALDGDGLLCDFHALERWLAEIVRPFRDGDLNSTPPFDRINPTAERIAEHIGA